jgi:hypothetical protein
MIEELQKFNAAEELRRFNERLKDAEETTALLQSIKLNCDGFFARESGCDDCHFYVADEYNADERYCVFEEWYDAESGVGIKRAVPVPAKWVL